MYVKNPTLLWQNACECLGRTFHIQVWEFCYFYLENFRQRNSKITVHDFWTHQYCCLGTIIQQSRCPAVASKESCCVESASQEK